MDRRTLLAALAMGVVVASPLMAASFEDSVVAQLQAQGYGKISMERTLLGRVRILAEMNGLHREIILNPRTGEVLRDVVLDATGDVMPQIGTVSQRGGEQDSGSGSGSSGSSGSNDDDGGDDNSGGDDSGGDDSGGDDSGGDDGGDDNSGSGGSGSGGSGSGSSGSGSGHSGSGHSGSGHGGDDHGGDDDGGDDD